MFAKELELDSGDCPEPRRNWWKGSKQGTDLARFRYTTGGQCGGRLEGESCRRLVTSLTDFDFVGHPLKGPVIQGSWIPPQPQGLKFD